MSMKFDVAVVGATGLVGQTMIEVLEQRQFPVNKLYPLASERSAGETVEFKGRSHDVGVLSKFDFSQVQFALFSAGADVAEKYAPIAAEQGCIVIDNSSQFRYEADIPLIVPEVNAHHLENFRERNIIANPNCVVIPLTVALNPIHEKVGLARINVVSFQSVSGAGKDAVEELTAQTIALMNGQKITPKVLPKRIAFNIVPQCDKFQDNGYTFEEMKIIKETQKIFEDDFMMINPTAVRVPVYFGHSIAAHIEMEDTLDPAEARELLRQSPGLVVMDDPEYPTLEDLDDAVFVGRIRKDLSHVHGLDLWIVSDNIRKGAALNAVQIAEIIIDKYL